MIASTHRGAAVAVVIAALAGCASQGAPRLQGMTQLPRLQVSSVALPDAAQRDRTFTTVAEPGGLLFVYFGYTSCPDICPTTLGDIRVALKELSATERARVEVAMVSVDPERDRGPVLARYLAHFFAAAHALRTDNAAALDRAERAFGVRAQIQPHRPGQSYGVTHTSIIFVIDEKGAVVDEWPSGTKTAAMAADTRLLLRRTTT